MKFLIIIPVYNEEEYVTYCLKSIENQTYQDYKIILVNDGSTDQTEKKIKDFVLFSPKKNDIGYIHLKKSEHQPGAKIVKAFYKGLEWAQTEDYDIICKFDSDIIFPAEYLERLKNTYETQSNMGMVSGLVLVKKSIKNKAQTKYRTNQDKIFDFSPAELHHWEFENISSQDHIRGPIKSYRRKCLESIGGLRPILGWDNIDVLLAKKNNWETRTLKDLYVKHLRPTAYQYKKQKAEKLGEYFYNLGLSFPLMSVSAFKACIKTRSVSDFFVIQKSFFKQNHPLLLTKDEIDYIRTSRRKNILKAIREQLKVTFYFFHLQKLLFPEKTNTPGRNLGIKRS
ncbi:MAG: glycosyltransferase family 2 protein [Bergeyella sp.]|nr:glycosyltransferase family 2 protein [Bergeyella sp.]